MKKLIIFDVCNTFVDTNSTFSYVDYLINKWIKSWYKTFFHNRVLWYFYTILYLLFRFDFKIFLTKRYFRRLNVKEIDNLSQEYFKRYENKIFSHMLEIINKEKRTSKVIFLSSSINPPIDFLERKFKVDSFSSKLEEKNWIYTWKVLEPLWWRKEIVFKNKKFDLKNYEEIKFYTDNLDDINLIRYFSKNNKDLKIYIRSYWDKKYWDDFLNINKIKYEYLD